MVDSDIHDLNIGTFAIRLLSSLIYLPLRYFRGDVCRENPCVMVLLHLYYYLPRTFENNPESYLLQNISSVLVFTTYSCHKTINGEIIC